MTVTQTRTGQYTVILEPTASDQILIGLYFLQSSCDANPLIYLQRPKSSPFAGLGFVSTTASCNSKLPLTTTQTLSSGLSLQHLLAIDEFPKAFGPYSPIHTSPVHCKLQGSRLRNIHPPHRPRPLATSSAFRAITYLTKPLAAAPNLPRLISTIKLPPASPEQLSLEDTLRGV